MGEIIRQAAEADAERLFQVISEAYRSIRELGIEFRAVHADLDMVRSNVAEHTCYVLELDGVIAATLSLKSLPEVTPHPFVYWFAVDPAASGRGIGSRLLTYVERDVVRDTLLAPAVVLATSRKHPWLLPMYRRRGYEPFFERPLGQDDTLVFMKKTLLPASSALPG
ncbi:GNAT family N-acetyltransferase [Paenibacillus hamazuiensis]|uniref:GNAT family N-acetyltransferase n=1 Tax=Paenibacillus hamazuiensis TaxID=2936508 RepID=UPI00200D0ABE|nr:GNAT family N-acetyltransferase [Paenibacillus hamazuiensis]